MKIIRALISAAAWSYLALFLWEWRKIVREDRQFKRDLQNL